MRRNRLGYKALPGKDEDKQGNDAKRSLPGYQWTKGGMKKDRAPLWDDHPDCV